MREERSLAGLIGRGPVHYILLYKNYEIFVTESKGRDMMAAEYHNVAQLHAAQEARRAEKRKFSAVDGSEADLVMIGAITDAVNWIFIQLAADGKSYLVSDQYSMGLADALGDRASKISVLFRTLHWLTAQQIARVNAAETAMSAAEASAAAIAIDDSDDDEDDDEEAGDSSGE
eukprot:m.180252 g.180252  ORF g.180252 m.180252 type:complete len:174 (+) comp9990_c2_seq26:728-1249(+)